MPPAELAELLLISSTLLTVLLATEDTLLIELEDDLKKVPIGPVILLSAEALSSEVKHNLAEVVVDGGEDVGGDTEEVCDCTDCNL